MNLDKTFIVNFFNSNFDAMLCGCSCFVNLIPPSNLKMAHTWQQQHTCLFIKMKQNLHQKLLSKEFFAMGGFSLGNRVSFTWPPFLKNSNQRVKNKNNLKISISSTKKYPALNEMLGLNPLQPLFKVLV